LQTLLPLCLLALLERAAVQSGKVYAVSLLFIFIFIFLIFFAFLELERASCYAER
jgi:hypothetical protein